MAKARDIPGLDGRHSFRAVARAAVSVRAAEVFEHAAGVLDTDDIERVHDMRVATRRLRAVLEIFAPAFDKDEHKAVLKDVKALADALGARRDPDVAARRARRAGGSLPAGRPRRASRRSPTRPRRAAGRQRDARRRAEARSRTTTSQARLAAAGARARQARREGRKVKGVDPDGAAADEVAKIVAVRLDELCSFMPAGARPRRGPHAARHAHRRQAPALRPGAVGDQFGPYAERGRQAGQEAAGRRRRDPRLRRHAPARARRWRRSCAPPTPATSARWRAADAKDLDLALAAQAPHRAAYRGLMTMDVALRARRDLLFDRFLVALGEAGARGLPRAGCLEAITSRSHGGNGDLAGRRRTVGAHLHMTPDPQPLTQESIRAVEAVAAAARRPPEDLDAPELYINRELSWVDFDDRVLQLAEDPSQPLLERCKFAAIFSSNLDEFFMIRVAGLHDQVDAGITAPKLDGRTPAETIDAIRAKVDALEHAPVPGADARPPARAGRARHPHRLGRRRLDRGAPRAGPPLPPPDLPGADAAGRRPRAARSPTSRTCR